MTELTRGLYQTSREFISNNYPKELKDSIGTKRKTGKELSRDDLMSWHKILGKHNGWSAPGWPKQSVSYTHLTLPTRRGV